MGKFTSEEIAYLQSQRFGRLATVSQDGELHVVPVTFRYHPEHESIDSGGENLVQTKKYRDAVRHGRVAFVVDDVLPPCRCGWSRYAEQSRDSLWAEQRWWHLLLQRSCASLPHASSPLAWSRGALNLD